MHNFTFSVEIDPDKCTGCGICAIECPSRVINMVARPRPEIDPNCSQACLAQNDVRVAMHMVREGASYEEAWKVITAINPLPACVGRACPHPCEEACSRSHLDQAVNLHDFERFVGDYGVKNGLRFDAPPVNKKERVAVIGGGPSGLSCAYHLAMHGYPVTVYEMRGQLGGMLRYGVPEYRVPKHILNAEIKNILDTGIQVKYGKKLGKDISLNTLKSEYDAIYLAPGTQKEMDLGVKGEEHTLGALEFLRSAAENNMVPVGDSVAVVGGGNVAIDAARTALRAGAKKVTVVCLESRYEMPALKNDIEEALEEGIQLMPGYGIAEIQIKNGAQKTVLIKKCISLFDADGNFAPQYEDKVSEKITADNVIKAIGQRPDTAQLGHDGGVKTSQQGHIYIVDETTCQTNVIGVYAGGDATRYSNMGSIAGGIGMGRQAAIAIESFLSGEKPVLAKAVKPIVEEIDQLKYNRVIPRNEAVEMDPQNRINSMASEITPTLDEKHVRKEMDRCLVCTTAVAQYTAPQNAERFNMACNNCHNCVSECKEGAITFKYTTITRYSDFSFQE